MKSEVWLKVLIGAILTLMLLGFSVLETRKLDKAVFDLYRDQQVIIQERVENQLTRIEVKIDKINEKVR